MSLRRSGFTLIELMITVAIAAILASVAIPGYQALMNKSRTAEARRELMVISMAMERYYMRNGRFPAERKSVPARSIAPREVSTNGLAEEIASDIGKSFQE